MSEEIFQFEIRRMLPLSFSRGQRNVPCQEMGILASLMSVSFTRIVVELDLRSTSSMVSFPLIAKTPSPAENRVP